MLKNAKVQGLLVLALGVLLGYGVATGKVSSLLGADEEKNAVQVTGVLGSPGATTTISGKQLPPPDAKFGGVIKDDALQSKYWWAPSWAARRAAPTTLSIGGRRP